ncbi:MAG: orotidine 5'-phosphate decarboxylase [Candidatus Doudnabacteria bacterium RIFCSPLOWO2_02_FULL_49_13]|uniref:Orotidine 5'-phosphate decarboxylase n=1 Tax=Candidatus Doudnabacteria bacterium RIFCSPHIGHO2_12_FULL_48_16 TaxID=1817838 RepID=A0A1F5PJR9_9BACT|nr:MAG: orotidine 5'-phosphate decarboxylase [Candidatus Doudnabacteria bacterium RIFCSPHIGHO2_02_FULL_49_24]OGE90195.1 MAG: orotidine 5'-phosphate decarboxylase [Candidatus Doudnabacteria bacterium RIFCSPHIGHO2_12_FULL_48_16]OGE97736.1 MAG: orotidine 5'-phosphate decarboxylase [Candidatus Doudnabacteria bacterium RIFCSPLOWO2_01_FULL_49_40]OGF02883.1 MAG: orotidine 5'-phosphate decarboxylase [Candidatus Doudnabacteria bacterium RIFCSPLOWO2_12_FULL_49_8]OGF03338.1 MAG: orotidine 5'-phosphate dec
MKPLIILALDGLGYNQAVEKMKQLEELMGWIKAAKIHDLWDECGPSVAQMLKDDTAVAQVMADLKIEDIPVTAKKRVMAVCKSAADIVTVHIAGGIDMLYGALDGADGKIEVWGITALTSLGEEEVHLTTGQPSKAVVLQRARNAKLVELNGIVCSPQELAMLSKRRELQGLPFYTPGVRSAGVKQDDQARVDTHENAFKNGASGIVVGREFSEAADPKAAIANIVAQISAVTN